MDMKREGKGKRQEGKGDKREQLTVGSSIHRVRSAHCRSQSRARGVTCRGS